MILPKKDEVIVTNDEDPLIYYYGFWTGWLYRKRLQMALNLIKDDGVFQSILDIGYGSGILFKELAGRCKELYGIDTHDKNNEVEALLKKININATLRKGDILNLPYENDKFDCVFCISVLEHIQDLDKATSEIKRVLKPNATAIIGFPIRNFITDIGFETIVGRKQDTFHVSDQQQILIALKRNLTVEKEKLFPGILPMSLSLYMVTKCKKH